jgi:hypothetical protein
MKLPPFRALKLLTLLSLVGLVLVSWDHVTLWESRATASSIIYANSSTGDDATGDGTSNNPFRTFHKAYQAAAAGNTVDLTGTFTWSDTDETGDTSANGYTLSKNLTIRGQGRSTIVQAAASRNTADRMVFFIGRGTRVTLEKLTIRHGKVVSDDIGAGITLYGEYCGQAGGCAGTTGILTIDQVDVVDNDAAQALNSFTYDRAGGIMLQENAQLTVLNSNVANNNCVCKYYAAGGIYGGMQSSTITIVNSSVSNNTVTSDGGSAYPYEYTSVAGGLASQRFGSLTVTNSTFYGNSTNSYGGAMSLYYQSRGVRLTNVSIVGNSASLGAGGILWNQLYTGNNYDLRMKNVLLADNTGVSGAASDFYAKTSTSGAAVVATHSIVESSTSVTFSGVGMITGDQASLNLAGSLAVNGSPKGSRTVALLAGSVAIDAGDSVAHGQSGFTVTPPSSDQREEPRVGIYDIGAYEFDGVIPTTTTTTTSTTSTTTTTAVPQVPASSGASPPVTSNVAVTASTVLVPSTSVTVGGLLTVSSSTTTTVAASTTTSSPDVQDDAESAPEAPFVDDGEAIAFVDGEAVAMNYLRENNSLLLSGAGFTARVAAVTLDGTVVPLDVDGNLRLDQTRLIKVELTGIKVATEVELWIFSDPVRVGAVRPDSNGSVVSVVNVPNDVVAGQHRFVIKAVNESGNEATMAVRIYLGGKDSNVDFGWLIGVPLSLAIATALIIPATRRRRRLATID